MQKKRVYTSEYITYSTLPPSKWQHAYLPGLPILGITFKILNETPITVIALATDEVRDVEYFKLALKEIYFSETLSHFRMNRLLLLSILEQ
jgi:hypothetical protein